MIPLSYLALGLPGWAARPVHVISGPVRRYFLSGWAFLVPYLASYLLYAWLKWPVNPGSYGTMVPSLLHVFWALHFLHLLMLAASAVMAWACRKTGGGREGSAALVRMIPWLSLALLVWLPGVSLEYPSDPYEHFARATDWARHTQVSTHVVWFKSTYFLAYSFVALASTIALKLACFGAFYTGSCLLLFAQYYRLCRALGLERTVAFIALLVYVFTFGNSIFGFHRYYGMSSTVFTQLCAIAAIRIAVDCLPAITAKHFLRMSVAIAGPLLLTAVSHAQGLVIASVGIGAVLISRVIQHTRAAAIILLMVIVVLNVAAVFWFPRHSALTTSYQQQGWMTSWGAFNVLEPGSPATQRAVAILGFVGLISVLAGIWLACTNHLVGWLTIVPCLALLLPVVAIPFANGLAFRRPFPDEEIVLFHRLLLGIPSGLAIVMVTSELLRRASLMRASPGFLILAASLFAIVGMPAGAPYFNRLWHNLAVVPDDLAFKTSLISDAGKLASALPTPRLLAGPGLSFIFNAAGVNGFAYPRRLLRHQPTTFPSEILPWVVEYARVSLREGTDLWLVIPHAQHLYTPTSQAAQVSGHWLPQEVAIEHAGGPELQAVARSLIQQGSLVEVSPYLYRPPSRVPQSR